MTTLPWRTKSGPTPSGYEARCDIASGEVIDGELPRRAERLVREWASLQRAELEQNWRRCEQKLPLTQVDALP